MGFMQRRGARAANLMAGLLLSWVGFFASAQHAYPAPLRPVKVVSRTWMPVDTPKGTMQFPLYLSTDWTVPQLRIERAVIVIHGKLRNANVYFHTALKARDAAGADPSTTLLIAPQFLATLDTQLHDEPPDLLRWKDDAWMGGDNAEGDANVSSYAVLDAIVARLADRRQFPNLRYVTFAGHSGGGQVVQRYAVAAHETQALADEGIDVRYVVSSPSSYAYFDKERPDASGAPAPFDAARCPGFDAWKYGMDNRPAYVADRTPAQLEAAYVKRRIDYLVGGDDDDPRSARSTKVVRRKPRACSASRAQRPTSAICRHVTPAC